MIIQAKYPSFAPHIGQTVAVLTLKTPNCPPKYFLALHTHHVGNLPDKACPFGQAVITSILPRADLVTVKILPTNY